MKKILIFIPAVIALLFYIVLGFGGGFDAISVWAWFGIVLMILSSLLMYKEKWYGFIGALISTAGADVVTEIEHYFGRKDT